MLSAECSDSRESSLALAVERDDPQGLAFRLVLYRDSTEGRSILETHDLAAELAADNNSIVFTRNGKLVTTLQNINPALAPRAVYKPLRSEDANVEVTSGADGMRSTLDAVDREFDRTAYLRM